MPDNTARTAGYAPATGVLAVIEKMRQHTISGPVDVDLLRRIGIVESLVKRTLNALRALGLINDDGSLTEAFDALIAARPDDYQTQFAEFVQRAYASVFAVLDPTTATADQLRNAFWGYEPRGQIDQMIRLFLALCGEAGIVQGKVKVGPATTKRHQQRPGGNGQANSNQNRGEKPNDPPPPAGKHEESRAAYLQLLLTKAAAMDDPPADLLDRIERALGIPGNTS